MGQYATPKLDDALRRRMVARYGGEVESWLDELPPVLGALADRWQLELESLIPRGHMSVVMRCRTADGSPTVLKVCFDRGRLATEAAALQGWSTPHMPTVLAVDGSVGALLIEAIVPGTMFLESTTFPVLDVARLLTSLHTTGKVDRSYPPLALRVVLQICPLVGERAQRVPARVDHVTTALGQGHHRPRNDQPATWRAMPPRPVAASRPTAKIASAQYM